MGMHAGSFVVVDNRGPIGVGWFDFVEWHKKEKDDHLTELGITPVYGDVPDYGHKQRGWLSMHACASRGLKRASFRL